MKQWEGGENLKCTGEPKLDEKPPCSQWGETENLRNMAAACCNASTLQRVALSLPLFIISRSKAPAERRLWGKKRRKKTMCLQACTYMTLRAVVFASLARVCVCVCLPSIHIKQFWRWMHFPGCQEFKGKHPSWRNTVSQVETEGPSPASDWEREEETEVADGGVCGPTSPIMFPLDKFH